MTISIDCDVCDDYGVCSGIVCPEHRIWTTGYAAELDDALDGGACWGDIVLRDEKAVLSLLSPAEIAKRTLAAAAADASVMAGVKNYEIAKKKALYTTADGVSKRKFNLPCKKQAYDGGCWLHTDKKGACSFIHTEEEPFYNGVFKMLGVGVNKCIFVTGVDASGDLTFSKTAPAVPEETRGNNRNSNSNNSNQRPPRHDGQKPRCAW